MVLVHPLTVAYILSMRGTSVVYAPLRVDLPFRSNCDWARDTRRGSARCDGRSAVFERTIKEMRIVPKHYLIVCRTQATGASLCASCANLIIVLSIHNIDASAIL